MCVILHIYLCLYILDFFIHLSPLSCASDATTTFERQWNMQNDATIPSASSSPTNQPSGFHGSLLLCIQSSEPIFNNMEE